MISEAVESLIRIQSKNLDQQLFNKANEIQEEISRKRFDLRCAQIQLAGIRAQVSKSLGVVALVHIPTNKSGLSSD